MYTATFKKYAEKLKKNAFKNDLKKTALKCV